MFAECLRGAVQAEDSWLLRSWEAAKHRLMLKKQWTRKGGSSRNLRRQQAKERKEPGKAKGNEKG